MSDQIIERIKRSYGKKLVLLFEGAELQSIKYWRSIEDRFEGELFFGIDAMSKKRKTINVFLYTNTKESDVVIEGLSAYLSWQSNQIYIHK